jgi:hypothetical protein
MRTYHVRLEKLNGNHITSRTGKSIVKGTCDRLPNEMTHEEDRFYVFYGADEKCESPGVGMEVHGLEMMGGNEFQFYDYEGKKFQVTVLEELEKNKGHKKVSFTNEE